MQEFIPGVSVLVCTFNGAARITETLTCLAQQRTPLGIPWEIILVDNASTDNTAALAQEVWRNLGAPTPLHLLQESRPGKQHALETALSHVQYTYTCTVDDDNRLSPDYLYVGVELLQNYPQIGILGGPNTATFESSEPAWFTTFQHCYAVGPQLDRVGGGFAPLSDGNVGRNVLWGAGMFVRSAVWKQLNAASFHSLFTGRQGEANLTAGEDDELCYATQLLGYEVWYSSQLRLQHHMTAGRLTETYRDRLFYASAYSTNRLNAYRNALWGQQGGDSIRLNLVKDIAFSILGVLKRGFSMAYLQALFSNNYQLRMNQWHAMLVIADALWHFNKVSSYYEQVLQFKRRLRLSAVSKSVGWCTKS
jgi:glycosyltransferase involved in cell wall biosynthesis